MQRLLRESLEAGAWGWSTTDSPTHAGPAGQPVPTRLAADEERVALGRTLGEFNRGIIEILPKGAGKPTPADLDHLRDVAVASGRPVFFLSFDTNAWPYVEKATREGAAALQPAAGDPLQPALHAEEDDLLPQPRRLGRRHAPAPRRAAGRAAPTPSGARRCASQALKPQRRRPGVPGRLVPWSSIFVRKVKLAKNQGLVDQSLTDARRAAEPARRRRHARPGARGRARHRVPADDALGRGRGADRRHGEERSRAADAVGRRRSPQHQLLHGRRVELRAGPVGARSSSS